MAAYHQMGHDSWNLVDEKVLPGYAGLILSPVNDTPDEVATRLIALKKANPAAEVILDPQFYQPSSNRGQLLSWPHFTADVDTANLADDGWWDTRGNHLIEIASKVGASAVCSPAMLPKQFDHAYPVTSP